MMDIDEIFNDLTSDIKEEGITEGVLTDDEIEDRYLTEEEIVMEGFKDTKIGSKIFKEREIKRFKGLQNKIESTKLAIETYKEKIKTEKAKGAKKSIKKIRKYELKISQLFQNLKKLIVESKAAKKAMEITDGAKEKLSGAKDKVKSKLHKESEDEEIYDNSQNIYETYVEEFDNNTELIRNQIYTDYMFEEDMTEYTYNKLMELCNESVSDEENDVTENFSIASMLPQTPLSSEEDIIKLNEFGDIIDDEEEIEEEPTCYEEDQIVFSLKNENSDYDIITSDCIHTLMEAALPHINLLSGDVQNIIGKKAYLVTKYNYLKESADPVRLRYIKRECVATEQELRSLMRGFSEKSNRLIQESTDFLKEILENSVVDENETATPSVKEDPSNKETSETDKVEIKEPVKKSNPNESNNKSIDMTTESMNTIDLTKLGLKDLLACKSYFENEIASMRNDDMTVVNAYTNKLKYINKKLSDNAYLETANIEEEMQPIVDQLNSKGYATRYSSPGHTDAKRKDDKKKDGIKAGKLYIDARIMFDDKFGFKKPPEGWIKRTVDGCDYIQPEEIRYNKKDGTPEEAKEKWKKRYMSALTIWADELPDNSEGKSGDTADVKDTSDTNTSDSNTDTNTSTQDGSTDNSSTDTTSIGNSTDTTSTDNNTTDGSESTTTDTDKDKNKNENTKTEDSVNESYQDMMDDLTFEIKLL